MGTKRNWRWLSIGVGLATALLVPAAAQAANPACGATIKHDVKLTSNMDCSGSATAGLIVGKAGVTINLNGHALIGPGNSDYFGVDDTEGWDHFTLENGAVRGYGENVYVEYATGPRILHVHAGDTSAATYGIDVEYSTNAVINHSTAAIGNVNDYAFYLYENTNEALINSKVSSSAGNGLYDDESTGKIVNVSSNGTGGYGFYVEQPLAQGYLIKDSTANGNASDGFYIYENYPTALYQATLVDNKANNNGGNGFYADVLTKGSGNRATGNSSDNCFHVPCAH
jgi:hypothetical protein